jgi:hypothetical protein
MTSVAYGLAFPATRGVLAFHASGFNPTTLFAGDSGGWWDPADSATVWQDTAGTTPAGANDPVARIDDKSGNGNHLLQATSTKRPMLRNSGALWWLEFDGVDDFLTATFTLNQPINRISALQQVTWTSGDRLWDGGTLNGCVAQQLTASPRVALYAGSNFNYDLLPVAEDHVLTEIIDGASSKIATDNATYTTGNTGTGSAGGATLAASPSGVQACDLHWFGAIWIGRLLSDPEIAQARTYFGAKAGLSL